MKDVTISLNPDSVLKITFRVMEMEKELAVPQAEIKGSAS